MTPVTLTIAGSDCCSGAGIQADLKTFCSLGVHGLTAVTAVVAETPHLVDSIFAIAPDQVASQIRSLASVYPITAIKTGMLNSVETAQTVAESINKNFPDTVQLVVDPVLTASAGADLSPSAILEIYKKQIFPRTSLITPNIPEAEAILGITITDATIADSALQLQKSFNVPCLLKGGHLENSEQCIDYLATGESLHTFTHPRLKLVHSHGTGCTLSAAITAYLAKGETLHNAVKEAIQWTHTALSSSLEWRHNNTLTQCINQAQL